KEAVHKSIFQKSFAFDRSAKRASASPLKETVHVSKKAKVGHAATTPHIHLVNNSGKQLAEVNGSAKGKHARQNGATATSTATPTVTAAAHTSTSTAPTTATATA